jgi:hypothetical protein
MARVNQECADLAEAMRQMLVFVRARNLSSFLQLVQRV